MKKFKKLLAGIMTLAMLVTMLPATVLAADDECTDAACTTPHVAKIGEKRYHSIQDAINAAATGETVQIMEGTYAVPSMKAGITLEGAIKEDGTPAVRLEGTLGSTHNITLKNLHIKGGNAQRDAYASGNVLFENVTFEATGVYAIHYDGATDATLEFKDCTIIGWAALGGSASWKSCTFDGCIIKGNGTYGVIRTYYDATISNCTFDVANVNPKDSFQDGIHVVDSAKTVVNNCTNKNGNMEDIIFAAARIGNVYYGTLQAALKDAKAGDIIILKEDTTVTKDLTIPEGVTVKGNLILNNGKTIDNNGVIDGNVVIVMGELKGTGTVTGAVTNIDFGTNKFTKDGNTVIVATASSSKDPAKVEITYNGNTTIVNIPVDGQSEMILNTDGTATVNTGNTIIVNGNTITVLEGSVTLNPDITVTIPEGSTAKVGDTEIEVVDGNVVVNKDGTVTVSEGSVIKVNGNEISLPYGGTINADGTVTPNPAPPAPSTSSKKSTKKYAVSIDADEIENGIIKLSHSKAKKGATVTLTVTPDAGYELDKLVVLNKDGNEVELKDKGDGKFTFKMPRGGVEVDASFAEADAVVAKDTAKIVLTIDSIVALVNGEPVVNDVAPIIKGERTFLPIRLIAEELGATVTWNEAEQSVTIVKDDMTIVIYIGQAFALVNGEPVQLDEAAFIVNGRTYLPLRFVAENLGAVVTWDGLARTVTIVAE